MSGLLFFFSSMIIYRKLIQKSIKYSGYNDTLKLLFQPSRSVSSRHGETKSAQEMFKIREQLFRTIYNDNIHHKCNVIHVAGTKGKGSTVEYISSGLIGFGAKVGIFTSPHLHTARERIKLGRNLISKEDMVHFGNISLNTMTKFQSAVFFDVLLTAALLFFGRREIEYLVMESGIGGRYDSTNFVEAPVACVITSISLDHQGTLGDTLEEIAWQKAGIIKDRSHVFTPATQRPEVLEVFRQQCRMKQATLHIVPASTDAISELGIKVNYDVQLENACLAHAVLTHLRVPTAGMRDFYWPCRMERFRLSEERLDIVLDGCHNGDSVHQFVAGLAKKFPDRRVMILFGAGLEKCLDTMLHELLHAPANVKGEAPKLLIVQSRHFKSLSERDLLLRIPAADRLQKVVGLSAEELQSDQPGAARTLEGTVAERLQWAIDQCVVSTMRDASENVVVAVCGSLFVAAEAREHLFSMRPSLFAADDWVRECDSLD